jgi:hypothetical protein
MILLGLDNQKKDERIREYCAEHGISKVFILSPSKFRFVSSFPETEHIEWAEIIQYKFFYRLLQEINKSTLVVVNECLRLQNRNDLTYNCIRHFLNQTAHQIVFQYLPLIEDIEDFMILFDFDTRSRWKREKLSAELLKESVICIAPVNLRLSPIPIETDQRLQTLYQKEKAELIAGIGLKDPHTIPRNLYLMSGKARLGRIEEEGRYYVGRNNRFKIENFQTYRELLYPNHYTVFEFCHNFIDFTDFLSLCRQSELDVLVADLKVDQWYFERYASWCTRLQNGYAILQQREERLRCGA